MRIGIDIGGTTIGAGIENGGRIIRRTDGPSFREGAPLEETLSVLEERIARLMGPEIESIGIGAPSVVDPLTGIVYEASNIPSWKEVHLKEHLEDRFGVRVAVDNDANCYALGASVLLGCSSGILTGITLGTGVGVGIVSDGHLFRGRNCGAGELCCLPYEGTVIEDYTSSKFFSSRGTSAREASEAGRMDLFEQFGIHLGKLVETVLYAYDPDIVVFGGGIARAFDKFEKALWSELRKGFFYQSNLRGLRIISCVDPDTALLGAASL